MGLTVTQEQAQSKTNVVVLSHKMWRFTFEEDSQILGKVITLDAKSYSVIGVMPPAFNYPPRTELWMPLSISPAISGDYDHRYIRLIGRLKTGISVAEAQIRMNLL